MDFNLSYFWNSYLVTKARMHIYILVSPKSENAVNLSLHYCEGWTCLSCVRYFAFGLTVHQSSKTLSLILIHLHSHRNSVELQKKRGLDWNAQIPYPWPNSQWSLRQSVSFLLRISHPEASHMRQRVLYRSSHLWLNLDVIFYSTFNILHLKFAKTIIKSKIKWMLILEPCNKAFVWTLLPIWI